MVTGRALESENSVRTRELVERHGKNILDLEWVGRLPWRSGNGGVKVPALLLNLIWEKNKKSRGPPASNVLPYAIQ